MTEPIAQRTVRADFAAALESAFGNRITQLGAYKRAACEHILEWAVPGDCSSALGQVAFEFGPVVFGRVLLFGLTRQNSLTGYCKSVMRFKNRQRLGITVDSMRWPAEQLPDEFKPAAEQLPPCDFHGALLEASTLGYGTPVMQVAIENLLVHARLHGRSSALGRLPQFEVDKPDFIRILEVFQAPAAKTA